MRWKGGASPFDQIDRIDANPSFKKLGTLGLVEQPQVDLRDMQKDGKIIVPFRIFPFGAAK